MKMEQLNLNMKINRIISIDEYEKIFKICKNAVSKNYKKFKGKYFRCINEELSYYNDNMWRVEFKILAKGEYFNDRQLIYYYFNKLNNYSEITLDDHSQGENLDCVYELKKYLYTIGAYDYEPQLS